VVPALASASRILFSLRVLVVAAFVPALLRLDLARVQRLLEPRRARPEPGRDEVDRLVNRIEHVLAASRLLVRPGCLTRGVTLYYFLRRAGLDVRLVFGIGRPAADIEGHCWLVRDGKPFLERNDPRPVFTETYAIPGDHAPHAA
jgi:Transglutaminase-like superfamily